MATSVDIDQKAGIDQAVPPTVREHVTQAKSRQVLDERYPYERKMKRLAYEAEKADLQVELLKLQKWVKDNGERIVMLFEGRDAAGKGGTIKRFMEHLNPRGARVVALAIPTSVERGQWFFQRYISQLPAAGEMVFFDRSWYNRAVVEPVMGFCTDAEHEMFLHQAPVLERMLIESGIRLFKFWFSVSREEQYRRFKSRETDRLKQWKLSPVDRDGLSQWEKFTKAKIQMFERTDVDDSPWIVIRSDDKKRARLNCMRYVLYHLPYESKDEEIVSPPDPKIVGRPADMYEMD